MMLARQLLAERENNISVPGGVIHDSRAPDKEQYGDRHPDSARSFLPSVLKDTAACPRCPPNDFAFPEPSPVSGIGA